MLQSISARFHRTLLVQFDHRPLLRIIADAAQASQAPRTAEEEHIAAVTGEFLHGMKVHSS